MDRYIPVGYAINLLIESLIQAALLELKKPCIIGIIFSPLIINQLIIAKHCMATISEDKNYETYYFVDVHNMKILITVFKLKHFNKEIPSPVDLNLLCDELHVVIDNKENLYIVMIMNNAFHEIYKSQ